MNNLPQPNQLENNPTMPDAIKPNSKAEQPERFNPIMSGIDKWSIGRKIGLIPWCSLGGLSLILGTASLVLYGSLVKQLSRQVESRLNTKSQIVNMLSSEVRSDNLPNISKALTDFTEPDSYTAVYLPQFDGELALSVSSLNSGETFDNIALSDPQILERAVEVKGKIVSQTETIEGAKYALAAKTIIDRQGEPVGVLVYGSSFDSIYSILKSSLLTQAVLSSIVWLLIAYLSRIISQAIAKPIQSLRQVLQDCAGGNLPAPARVDNADEVTLLGSGLNLLADSIEQNQAELRQQVECYRLLKETAFDIALTANEPEMLQITVENARKILLCDRVIYQRWDGLEGGTVVAESVAEKFPQLLNRQCDTFNLFAQIPKYRQGQFWSVANIYQAELNSDYLKALEPWAVVAMLVMPVMVEDKLAGLLTAHQCNESRNWQDEEIELLSQIAFSLGRAIEKLGLLEQQRHAQEREQAARENLQSRALELLMEVDPVTQGDLTVQVKVREDEIGTIADAYNATIESLRKLVAQVKTAAMQVSTTTTDKNSSIQELSTGASAQTKEINAALQRIQGITNSIQAVANNAKAAEAVMFKAVDTVKAGDNAMTQTVVGFQEIRDTVATTAKKVKRLGESSQKISEVVNVISNFAEQTNLLALNASIEAAHAGEEGRGFAVVADEVRSLARQSAKATAEIEALVAEIQSETNEVVAAMEAGTQQVAAGTKLVDKTRCSLVEITEVSQEINRLVEEIAVATVEQSQDSKIVSQTMKQVAAISDRTASEAQEVSASFKDLLTVAQQLQESIAKFKVN